MTATAAALGLVVDRLFGEPPARWHPVAWFGTAMTAAEARWWADDRIRGAAHATLGVAIAVAPAVGLRRVLGRSAATVVASGVSIAGSMLEREAHGVARALADGEVEVARQRVGRLVGRSTDELDPTEISRAVVETVAENLVDAVTASLFWASVGGAPGVLAHRAVNTMDAMVGHRTERYERFGSVSARLDDVANWIPARITAAACAVAVPSRAVEIVRIVRRDAGGHPSPNGGVVEAAFAAALGIRLGGTNVYDGVSEDRGELGDGRPPTVDDVDRAVALARRVTAITALGGVGAQLGLRAAGRARRTRGRGRD